MNPGLQLFLKEHYAADLLAGECDPNKTFADWLDSQMCAGWEASGVKYTYRCLQPQNQDEYNAKRAMLEKFRLENSNPTAEELEKHRERATWFQTHFQMTIADEPLLSLDDSIALIRGKKPSK